MHDVQMQLQELKTRLDTERAEVFTEDERALVERVETLKQEFRDLLIELRRRRAADILSDDVGVIFRVIYCGKTGISCFDY